ncbi:thioredoxin [Spongorhabdus nitratireducens]
MSVLELKDKAHFEQVSSDSDWTLVDFWAPWCGPCKMMLPVLDSVAQKYADQLTTTKVNVDEQQALAGQFSVRGIPTLVLLHKGKPVDQLVGAQPEAGVSQWLNKHLESVS